MKLLATILISAAILGFGFLVAIRFEDRFLAWLLGRGRGRPLRTSLVISGLHASAIVTGFLIASIVAAAGKVPGSVAAFVVLALYFPLVLVTLPSKTAETPHAGGAREASRRQGASSETSLAVAIVGGFWSFVGFGVCLGAYFAGLNGVGILTT